MSRDMRLRRIAARTQPGHEIPDATDIDDALAALLALSDDEQAAALDRLAPGWRAWSR